MNVIILTLKYETKPSGNCKSLFHLNLVFKDVQPKKEIVYYLCSMIIILRINE